MTTGTVNKQLIQNKVKEISLAAEEFAEAQKALIEQRISTEGSTISLKVGDEASGFKSITAKVGKDPVTDGPVMSVMTNNIPGVDISKNLTSTSDVTAITGKVASSGVLDEVVIQANPKAMNSALTEVAGVAKNKVADIVSAASPIKDKIKDAINIEQTGGFSKEAGNKAKDASRKVSIELGNPFGSDNQFGSIMSGMSNSLPNLVSLAFGQGGFKSPTVDTNFVPTGTQLLNNRNIKVTPPPIVSSNGISNLSNALTKSAGGNPDWKKKIEDDVFKIGQDDAKWQGWNSRGIRRGGSYYFRPMATYDHIEAELRHAAKNREITTLILGWTGFGNNMDLYGVDFIHEQVKKKDVEKYGADVVNASPFDYGFNVHAYLHQSGLTVKCVPMSRRVFSKKNPKLQPLFDNCIAVMINAGANVPQKEVRKGDTTQLSADTITPRQWEVIDEFIRAFIKVFPGGEIIGQRDFNSEKIGPGFDVRAYVARKFTKDSTFTEEKIESIPSASELADREPATIVQPQVSHNKIPNINATVKSATASKVDLTAVASTFQADNRSVTDLIRQKTQDAESILNTTGSGITNASTANLDTLADNKLTQNLTNKFEAVKQGLKFDKIKQAFTRQY